MKIDLKILLVVLVVVLLVGFLEAEPSSRRSRRSGSSSRTRRSSSSSSRRRSSSYSRRRRSSSSSGSGSDSSSSSASSKAITAIIVIVVVGVIALIGICIRRCVYYIARRQREERLETQHEIHELETQSSTIKGPQDGMKSDGEPSNETYPALNTAFNNPAGVDAPPLLPYPTGACDQNPVYPQTSPPPYSPQEGIYPPEEVKSAPPYPPQSTDIAYPPEH